MIAVLLLGAELAFGALRVESPPVAGEPTVVIVEDASGRARGGETVRAVHRPGLADEREIAIGITDGLGRVRWTPAVAGVARLQAGTEVLPLRVGWPGPPVDVVALLGILGAAALGWIGFGLFGRRGGRV